MDASLTMAALAALAGYLAGSVSFARLMLHIAAPGEEFGPQRKQLPGSDVVIVTDSVSATTVRMRLGARYGCLTGILDMLKAIVPTLAFRLYAPDASYHLLCAAAVVAGHNWPVFNRFKGGRGLSAITGGLLVIDPLGLLVAIAGGWVGALVVGHMLIMRWGWMLLVIPWFWFTKDGWAHVGYIAAVNAMFWFSMRSELKQYLDIAKAGKAPSQETVTSFMGAGRGLGRFMDRYSLLALLKRRR